MFRHHVSFVIVGAAAILMHNFVPSLGQGVDVGGPVFQDECYGSVVLADADNNGRLTQDEYVTFARLQGPPGIVDNVQSFATLPPEYRAVFNVLACLCSDPVFGGTEAEGCCLIAEQIRVPSQPDDLQSDEDLRMLFAICALTDSAAQEVLKRLAPTTNPTLAPTVLPTVPAPTLGPTSPPTIAATSAPTNMPVQGTTSPVLDPTDFPTLSPVIDPTLPPTEVPTSLPTFQPTGTPTGAPTTAPTTATAAPTTLAPTGSPTVTPAPSVEPTTAVPTITPTALPTVKPLIIQTYVNYSIAFIDARAVDLVGYYSDLVLGMDSLAEDVAEDVGADIGGQRRLRRRLQDGVAVRALSPTRIVQIANISCNTAFTTSNDVCQDIRSEVTLSVLGASTTGQDAFNVDELKSTYETALFNEIFDGELQDELDEERILVLTGLDDGTRSVDPPMVEEADSDNLSSGAIGAIVAASLFGIVLPLCIFMYTRSRSSYEAQVKRDARYDPQHVEEIREEKPSELDPASASVDTSLYTDAAVQSNYSTAKEVGALGAGAYRADSETLGATQPDYGRASRKAVEAMEAGEDIVAEPEMDVQPDSSSNAGSSGWSSSAGLSSYNTGSMDDSTDAAAAAGATLAAIGVSSNLSRRLEADRNKEGGAGTGAGGGRVSRDQLDQLIEAGDWAAVGATAALLAAASDSQSQTSRSGTGSRPGSSAGSIDAARAAELDHLVEAGDWEGVVLAAARFEASDAAGSRGSRSGQSIDSASATDSATGGATASSPSVQSESLTASDDPSKVKKRQEIREEVEALVRRVVPEEIDNVDEMMNQFKGREEELVETLRTMQERAVAQKARAAGQRAAKTEARRSVQRGIVPGTSGVRASTGDGEAAQEGGPTTPASAAANSSASSDSGSQQQARTSLEQAIDAGDWEAVGKAAAMMSDASTGSPGDLDQAASGSVSHSSVGAGSRSTLSSVNAARAAELDAMIDRGDWTGVVAAAERFSQSDKKPASRSSRTKEEEEALAQAEKWAKIAQQNKPGATDTAASEAAEWAIQRSLSQMKQAEKDEAGAPSNEDEDEV